MSQRRFGILGATGFVGRNLTQTLISRHIPHVLGSRSLGIDARDISSVIAWITNNNIDYVVNLAADCGGIGLNKERPADLWRSTTAISYIVLEACRLTAVKKLTMIGSVCSYAKNCKVPFKEDYLMNFGMPESTNRAYGVAKLNALLGTQAYRQQYGLNAIYLIPVNLYGPMDNFDLDTSHVIPAIIQKCMEAKRGGSKEVYCWGTGNASREFLYVEDCADAIIKATLSYNDDEPLNVGTGNEITIKNLADKIRKLVGYNGRLSWDATKPDGQPRRRLDISRIKSRLGWAPAYDLDKGLKKTIEWFETSNHFLRR